jgi:opacity protein-like surface antigen
MHKFLLAAALTAVSMSAQAAVTTLTFEGAGDYTFLTNQYASDGIIFGEDAFGGYALTSVSLAGGGLSEFYNEPSPSTVMGFTVPLGYINVPLGFDTGFSFFYTSQTPLATVTAYDGLDGTGALLGTITLNAQFDTDCVAAQLGTFCNWTPSGFTFAGIARSLAFTNPSYPDLGVGFDNLTFGSAIPTGVPEPGGMALLLSGIAALAGIARKRR